MFSLGITSLILFFSLIIGIYYYLTRNYNYWSSRGIKGPKPIVLIGTFWQNFFKPIHHVALENTKKYGKIYGVYFSTRPILTIADPQLIKDINIKDFHIFVDRNDLVTGHPLEDRSLFNLKSEEWKKMRSIISPTFSSGKMRKMHPIIIDCVKRLEDVLNKTAQNKTNNEIELKKMMSNLTMDVISTCAFGTQIDIYGDKTNEFVTHAQNVLRAGWRLWVFFLLLVTFPKLLHWIGLEQNDPKDSSFFRNAIRSILARRKTQKGKHNDYLQLMINAQNKKLEIEEQTNDDDRTEEIFGQTNEKSYVKNRNQVDVTEDDILASSFLFFVAGYETTASLLSFVFYSLAVDDKCQQKLYEEVKAFDGNYDYETISKMPYLEACVAETLRKYNPLSVTSRMASEDYKLGDTGITIAKGTLVDFDIQTLHHSPEYYSNPDKWDPERFMPENRDKLVPYTYMPFGMGPRNCVGMRFALMEAKTAIAYLINRFRFLRTANTPVPLIPQKFQFLYNCGEIKVGIELRN